MLTFDHEVTFFHSEGLCPPPSETPTLLILAKALAPGHI